MNEYILGRLHTAILLHPDNAPKFAASLL